MIGTNELLIILGILVILFGAKKVPEFARSLGEAHGEFQKALKKGELELRELEKMSSQGENVKVRLEKLARDVGVSTKGKTEEQIFEEIRNELQRREVTNP